MGSPVWTFDPSTWVDGPPGTGTEPHAADFVHLHTDDTKWGASVDASALGLTNLSYLALNPGAQPGTDYTVTAASWAATSGGQATLTIGTNLLEPAQLISLTGASPSPWNFTLVPVVSTTSTTVTVSMTVNPGTWTSGGTIQADGVPAAIGMLKVDASQNLKLYGAAQQSGVWGMGIMRLAGADLTGQTANIGSTALLTAALAGKYRVSIVISVTTPASSSCTLPSVSVSYTHQDSGATITQTPIASSTTNTTANVQQSPLLCTVEAGHAINFSTGSYASVGATAMQYSIHISVEFLG